MPRSQKKSAMKEEIEILTAELDRLRAPENPGLLKRVWWGLFGRLVYSGPETCGHCKYWLEPKKKWDRVGDCKLLYGDENTQADGSCGRFRPRRRYKHRVR